MADHLEFTDRPMRTPEDMADVLGGLITANWASKEDRLAIVNEVFPTWPPIHDPADERPRHARAWDLIKRFNEIFRDRAPRGNS